MHELALYVEVSYHTHNHHSHQDVQLDTGTDETTVGKGYDETKRFPHAVVGEGGFRL